MVRKDTNRHYSLRKLKKGTASVAVALTVVGAGLASQTEVKANRADDARNEVLRGNLVRAELWYRQIQENDQLKLENKGLKTDLREKEEELQGLKDDVEKLTADAELQRLKNERHEEAELERLKSERHDHDKKEAERKALEDKLADKQEHLNGALRYINEKEAERKEKEAEQKKLKEEKQISDASRQGLRRDLDASREAKKQVEKALEEANSKLAALEKLNKELEESKKLTEKEKAELQAKLEAEAKALKEQLAKQAEELAKLRAEKASDSQTPDAKPGNKAVPGKGQAPQAGTKPNQNKAPMKETKRQLPSTGEAANPFFTAAALTVMATAGVAAVVKRKEEN
ncbi:plasminogen-binding group A steptococcal M-like protein PAM [Streptococcus pyogenes]|uniref:YSIRK-type signal peptide-containing protein n=1 Tax=Streptococcus pyogenes TaxID=1314 RepID=UPI0010A1D860|nr:YSIRK-type signal peptide-containing protein [Streptococcus pyogenes]VHL83234.1 plasminogen-binding group A steptococcal M-like protein PAM [Streptococcus pyogenes]VHM14571.1 plasminogen-binding group A steptococcal M-like protein PAM [Streptococcus pyogenes]VHM73984.1 plasminogen-binding group A steptococcal M-like protein PAM [Streptococcus pyogenes]